MTIGQTMMAEPLYHLGIDGFWYKENSRIRDEDVPRYVLEAWSPNPEHSYNDAIARAQRQHDYMRQLESENTTLARQLDSLHTWFIKRPDSDAYDTRLAEWYARGNRIFLLKEES
jgi:hypothetical protein